MLVELVDVGLALILLGWIVAFRKKAGLSWVFIALYALGCLVLAASSYPDNRSATILNLVCAALSIAVGWAGLKSKK